MDKSFSGACLSFGDSFHILDHLVPVADLFNIPVIVNSSINHRLIQKYYKSVQSIFIESPEDLFLFCYKHFSLLFVSGFNYQDELSSLLKGIDIWYCPHGHSDKDISSLKDQKLMFTYGSLMENRLRGICKQDLSYCIRIGHQRMNFYEEHADVFDSYIEKDLFSNYKNTEKTIFYSPSWEYKRNPSLLFIFLKKLINDLPNTYYLIVKLHPIFIREHYGQTIYWMNICNRKKNVTVCSDFPIIFPILKKTDIYIGDISSIGYDFLYYNRPMFFFNPLKMGYTNNQKPLFYNCGIEIPAHLEENIFSFIDSFGNQEELCDIRLNMYSHAFDFSKRNEDIVRDVYRVIKQLRV